MQEEAQQEITEYCDGRLVAEWRRRADDANALAPVARAPQALRAGRCSSLAHVAATMFMPVGWPESVTPDYTAFVAWNTVQAVSSYVRGVLSSHAVFKGVGVGSQAATALGAVFQFFVRDLLGMAGGIVFASLAGGNFDSNAKQWRLFADVANNVALALDLASPLVPGCFMLLVGLASVSRAMVGMAAGATHAALTQHFAMAGSNAADISAKADSRERASSIVGTLLGMAFAQRMSENLVAGWLLFLVLTWLHVWANMRALRCLVLSSLNEPRLVLLLRHYATHKAALSPQQVAAQETLLVPPLAAAADWLCGVRHPRIAFGARLTRVLGGGGWGAGRSRGAVPGGCLMQELLAQQAAAGDRRYMLLLAGTRVQSIQVVLHNSAGPEVQLRAFLQALHLSELVGSTGRARAASAPFELVQASERWAADQLPAFLDSLRRAGWALDKVFLPRPQWTATW